MTPAGATLSLASSGDGLRVEAVATEPLGRVEVVLLAVRDPAEAAGEPLRFVAARELARAEGGLDAGAKLEAEARDVDGVAIALVRALDATQTRRAGEVVQAALWRGEDVRQEAKLVLVEHRTAAGCEPCRPSDEATLLLAAQIAGAHAAEARGYLVAPGAAALAGLALGAVAGLVLVRRGRSPP